MTSRGLFADIGWGGGSVVIVSASCLVTATMAVASAVARDPRRWLTLVTCLGGGLVLCAATAVTTARGIPGAIVDPVTMLDPPSCGRLGDSALGRVHVLAQLVGWVFVVSGGLAMIGAAIVGGRALASSQRAIVFAATGVLAGAVPCATGVAVLRLDHALSETHCRWLANEEREEMAAILATHPAFAALVVCASMIAALAVVVSSLRAARARARLFGPLAPFVAGLFFVAGVSAFVASRSMAHDAANPPREPLFTPELVDDSQALPRSERGDVELRWGAVLRIRASGAFLDGKPDVMQEARKLRRVWDVLHTPSTSKLRPWLIIAADADVPSTDVARLAIEVRDVLWSETVILTARERVDLVTATLGALRLPSQHDALVLPNDHHLMELARASPRWGDVVTVIAGR